MSKEIPLFRVFLESFGSTPIVSSTLFRYRSYRSFVQHNGASKTRRYTFYGPPYSYLIFSNKIGPILNQKRYISNPNHSLPRRKDLYVRIAPQVDHSCDDDKRGTGFYPESISICIISSYIIGWRNPICQSHLNKHPCHDENEMKCRITICCLI